MPPQTIIRPLDPPFTGLRSNIKYIHFDFFKRRPLVMSILLETIAYTYLTWLKVNKTFYPSKIYFSHFLAQNICQPHNTGLDTFILWDFSLNQFQTLAQQFRRAFDQGFDLMTDLGLVQTKEILHRILDLLCSILHHLRSSPWYS